MHKHGWKDIEKQGPDYQLTNGQYEHPGQVAIINGKSSGGHKFCRCLEFTHTG